MLHVQLPALVASRLPSRRTCVGIGLSLALFVSASALLATPWVVFVSAREAWAALVDWQVQKWSERAEDEVFSASGSRATDEALERFVVHTRSEGVRYAALVSAQSGQVLHEAGRRSAAVNHTLLTVGHRRIVRTGDRLQTLIHQQSQRSVPPLFAEVDAHAAVEAGVYGETSSSSTADVGDTMPSSLSANAEDSVPPHAPPDGSGGMPWSWRPGAPPGLALPIPSGLDWFHPSPVMLIEFEPLFARNMEVAAKRGLLTGTWGAVLLAAVGIFAWRVVRQRERAEQDLAEERHLASLGQMSAVLAHEMRNPLASLKGNLQLLQESFASGSREHTKVARVVGETIRLETLTQTLLEFVRSRRVGKVEADPRRMLRLAAEATSDPRVVLELESAPATWSFDPDRMHVAVVNLLRNAVEASPANGTVQLRATHADRRLRITVRDRGPGLTEAALKTLFEPFATTRVRGTGLGLAVAKQVVQAHRGEIWGANHSDGGAEFVISLPDS